jgi:3-oxoacyl-[acyl-carrier protein] reductase
MQDLKDKVALITGGTRGIGRETAVVLARLGARVALTGTSKESAVRVASEIQSQAEASAAVRGYGLDLAQEAEIVATVDAVVAEFGRIDILVNNAGVTKDNLVLRMSSEEWDRVLQINLTGVFHCTKRVLKTMLKQRSGAIVTVSSIVGLIGNPGQANYAAAKAGLIGFTRSVAREYATKGIRANVITPGFIETDMTHALPEQKKTELKDRIPLGRLGRASDVAHAVAFLASDYSSYVTGQVLGVDGGMVM